MLTEKQIEIKNIFDNFTNVDQKWTYLLELSKNWPGIDSNKLDDIFIVPGCSSKMYLIPNFDGVYLYFEMDVENGLLSKGLGILAISIYNGLTPGEILKIDRNFFKTIGLDIGLTPTRANGFASILNQIYKYAMIYNELSK